MLLNIKEFISRRKIKT